MRTFAAPVATALAADPIRLAVLGKVTLANATTYRFTSWSSDLVVTADSSATYVSLQGWDPSVLQIQEGTRAQHATIRLTVDGTKVAYAPMIYGAWAGAQCNLYWCNPDDTSAVELMRVGEIGQIKVGLTEVELEYMPVERRLNNPILRVTTGNCDVREFGDARCGVNAATYTHAITITTGGSRIACTASADAQAAGYYTHGRIQWATGDNAGYTSIVRRHEAGGVFHLRTPTPYPIAVGDTADAIRGCDRSFATCTGVFSNGVNYRGMPHVPLEANVILPGGV